MTTMTAMTTITTMTMKNTTTVTATAVGGDNNSGNSGGRGHRQQSTNIGNKDTVVVATVMETAAAGAATTAVGAQTTSPGVGADGIAFATTWEGCGCWLWWLCVGLCMLVMCVLRAPVVLLETMAYWGSPESS